MTVSENLDMGGYTRTDAENKETLELVYEHFPRLKEHVNQVAGTLSGGEQQMLAMGRALIEPAPSSSCSTSPQWAWHPFWWTRSSTSSRRSTRTAPRSLLVEQNANMALKVAARGYVLETGKIVKLRHRRRAPRG